MNPTQIAIHNLPPVNSVEIAEKNVRLLAELHHRGAEQGEVVTREFKPQLYTTDLFSADGKLLASVTWSGKAPSLPTSETKEGIGRRQLADYAAGRKHSEELQRAIDSL